MTNEVEIAVLKERVRMLEELLKESASDLKEIRTILSELVANQNRAQGAGWTVKILFAVGGALASAVTWILANVKPHG